MNNTCLFGRPKFGFLGKVFLTASFTMVLAACGGGNDDDGSTSTPTATPDPTATPTVTPTAEPTAAPTEAPTATPTAVPTETPTATPDPTATPVPTDAPTATPTPTAAPVANLLNDPSFESGVLNDAYWQTDTAVISTDSANVSDGSSGVLSTAAGYVEIAIPADTVVAGEQYYVSFDASGKTGDSAWKDWGVNLYAEGTTDPVVENGVSQFGFDQSSDGNMYERAIAFVAPSSVAGAPLTLRINTIVQSAIDDVRLVQVANTPAVSLDFEDGDVSSWIGSGDTAVSAKTTDPLGGATSLSFNGGAAWEFTLDYPLPLGTIESGKRYLVSFDFLGVAGTDSPFEVVIADSVSEATIGAGKLNYAYFTSRQISGKFIYDVDRDASASHDWGSSSSVVLRFSKVPWNNTPLDLVIDNLTVVEVE